MAAFNAFGEMVEAVFRAGNDDPLDSIAADLAKIEALVDNVEKSYVARLEAAAAATGEPNQIKRNLDYGALLARKTQQLYGQAFAPEEIVAHLMEMVQATSIGFTLWDSIVTEVREKGGGHGQHRNTVWDELVVSSTSMYTTIEGKSVLLVTEEPRLLTAGKAAGAPERITDVAGYENLLGLPPWAITASAS